MFTLYFGEPSGRVPKMLRRHGGRALPGLAAAAAPGLAAAAAEGIKRSAGGRGLRGKGGFTWARAGRRPDERRACARASARIRRGLCARRA